MSNCLKQFLDLSKLVSAAKEVLTGPVDDLLDCTDRLVPMMREVSWKDDGEIPGTLEYVQECLSILHKHMCVHEGEDTDRVYQQYELIHSAVEMLTSTAVRHGRPKAEAHSPR